jgi:hypothetical protein
LFWIDSGIQLRGEGFWHREQSGTSPSVGCLKPSRMFLLSSIARERLDRLRDNESTAHIIGHPFDIGPDMD